MSKTLIIVESPTKCAKFKFLGPNYIIKASIGHFRGIVDGLKAINFNDGYKITYGINEGKQKVVAELRKAKKECSDVLIASDLDREGEAIAYHIATILNINPANAKRLIFQDMTVPTLRKAVANPGKIDMNKVRSQEARAVLDLLVGYEISPIVKNNVLNAYSAGRCQSPAVRLVCEREEQIENQATTEQFPINVILYPETNKNVEIDAQFKKKYTSKESVLKVYEKMLDNSVFKIANFDSKIVEHAPPKPYITTTIQQDCSSICRINPDETMGILQKLYQCGKITYMRTDSVVISKEALKSIEEEVKEKFGDEYYKFREYKNKDALAQEAHEAIRPTDMKEYPLTQKDGDEPWSSKSKRIYELVWKRTMASQMANQKVRRNQTLIDMFNNGVKYKDDQLECVIEEEEFPGWKKLYKKSDLENPDEETQEDGAKCSNLDDIKKILKEPRPDLYHKSASSKQTFNRAIGRYTQASLIKDLEGRGIGRPSTHPTIIKNITDVRGYVVTKDFPGVEKTIETLLLTPAGKIDIKKSKVTLGKEKRKLTVSEPGKKLVEFLMKEFDNIMDYKFTGYIEDKIDLIARAKSNYKDIVDMVYKTFHPKVLELKRSASPTRVGQRGEELGDYETEDGKLVPVILRDGQYGHYLEYDGTNYSLKYLDGQRRHKIVVEKDVEEAVDFIEETIEKRKKQKESPVESYSIGKGKYMVRKGQYGYYFYHNDEGYNIGERDPKTLTVKDCQEIIKKKKEWKSSKEKGNFKKGKKK